MVDLITVYTKDCPICGGYEAVTLVRRQFDAWRSGTLIQDAFPDMDKDQRELLISGTHPACWEKMFGSDEEGGE